MRIRHYKNQSIDRKKDRTPWSLGWLGAGLSIVALSCSPLFGASHSFAQSSEASTAPEPDRATYSGLSLSAGITFGI